MWRLGSYAFSQLSDEDMHQIVVTCQLSSIAIVWFEVDIKSIIVIFDERVYNGIGIFSNSLFLLFGIAIFPTPELISSGFIDIVGNK